MFSFRIEEIGGQRKIENGIESLFDGGYGNANSDKTLIVLG